MIGKMSILLVEDDLSVCRAIQDYAQSLEDVLFLGYTHEAGEGLDRIRKYHPDALILDLELHSGEGDGLTLLSELRKYLNDGELKRKPYVLITTNNPSEMTHNIARELGADFILLKHQTDYTPEKAVDFLRMIKNVIVSRSDTHAAPSAAAEPNTSDEQQKTADARKQRILKLACAELDKIGISPRNVGYQYLADSIALAAEENTHNIPAILGAKYGKTGSSVERAMQNAIERAWRTTPIDDLLENYSARIRSDRGVPTNTELINYYASKVRNEF